MRRGPFQFQLVGQEKGPHITSPLSKGAKAFNAFIDSKKPPPNQLGDTDSYECEIQFATLDVISVARTRCLNEGAHATCDISIFKFSPSLGREIRDSDIFLNDGWKETFANSCLNQVQTSAPDAVKSYAKDFSNLGFSTTGIHVEASEGFPGGPISCDFPLASFKTLLTKLGQKVFLSK